VSVSSAAPRRSLVVGAVLALLLVGCVHGAFAASGKGTLKVVKLKPFTVRGTGFKPAERVTITLGTGLKGTARGTATAKGTVVVTFPTAKATSCTRYAVRAVGAAGTRVILKPAAVKATCKPSAAVKFEGTSVLVLGSRFQPGEKVTLTFIANEAPHKRGTKASPTGAFKIDLGRLAISECSPYKLTIVGSLGSRVSMSQDALPC
jgi:hypothetical protein